MKFLDIMRIAAGNLKRNRLRTILTVSGVVVGVGAIVFLVSLGFGLQQLALEKIVNLEALKVITVTPGTKDESQLSDTVVQNVQKISGVTAVSPIKRVIFTFDFGKNKEEQVVYGVKPEYLDMENIKISAGGGFSSKDAKQEMIASNDILTELNLNQNDLLGKKINYLYNGPNTQSGNLKVVGIFDDKGVYVPFNTIPNDNTPYSSIKVRVGNKKDVPAVKKTIESMGYNTSVIQDQSDAINQVFYIVNIVLGGFGMIAFFVAAIGIFNTMTISLLERTHEIGVMKAIGGNNKDIAMIFITESALIGFLGGLFGLTCGWLFGFLINLFVNFIATQSGGEAVTLFSIPMIFGFLTIFFSFLISTIAGIWPARRAAKLNPLEALRYE